MTVDLTIDGRPVAVPEGATLLDACRAAGIETPTLCYVRTLTPVNVCRVCVVEVEGHRTLVPACSRRAEAGMAVLTDSERVRLSRLLVLEFLASSADLSSCSPEVKRHLDRYGARPDRYGTGWAPPDEVRDRAQAGRHEGAPPGRAETVSQPIKEDNELYVRDYAKCILCYKCVEACGEDAQNTFAISTAGRGFDARISTEFGAPLPDSACVYCGNCVAVCPTGALMAKTEHDLRKSGAWDPARQSTTDTICPFCGVGCTLRLRVQDNRIVNVTSPSEHEVTRGHLCIKGRFGWGFVHRLPPPPGASS